MDRARFRQLAGLAEAESAPEVGFNLRLSDAGNMRKAVDALLEAGLSVELGLVMGLYYFNFNSKGAVSEARKIIADVIDKSKESEWE